MGGTGVRAVGREDSWRDVVDHLAGAQKSNRGAAAYSRWVNRPLGRRLAATAFKLGRTPDQVTLVSAAVTFTGIVLLALLPPSLATGVVVAMLLVLGYALDAADGQLARLTGTGSMSGEWLDHVVDCLKISALHLAVLIGWYRGFDLGDGWLLVPIAFCAEAAVFFFAIILTEQLRRRAGAMPPVTADPSRPSVLRSLLVIPNDYGVLCLTFLLWGWHAGFVGIYAALAVVNVGLLAIALARWYAELHRIDAARLDASRAEAM
ncbi:CDP-alcohol phosphatidyltransferase family protein [Luteipulveratus sp. YIM 133132]|uniref:CDP-alcohol phosphatidyltransferase family protein n=1 Tax=Luteipulveratus flavus TaxID=3031728 RepID=UPI0023AF3BCD|nr:CDP-alcohol phosphatidyltransferase family protein [Luteipulveratus sp. YIM 133132]MDE9364331.1 CDP-alcohol phosphatidyltransferase family protein [Luteipulveratus sp. YIM 133132]